MADYQAQNGNWVLRRADNAHVPINLFPGTSNPDTDAYQAWVAGGGVPDTAPDPTTELTGDALDAYNARNYAKLKTLAGMTPSQIVTWVNNNVNTEAEQKDAIKTALVAIGILARRI